MEDMVIEARADIGDYIEFGKYDMLNTDFDGDVKLDTEDNPEVFRSQGFNSRIKIRLTRDLSSL